MIEPRQDEMNKVACVTHEDSDEAGPKVIKNKFMLNSTEHEIFPAYKC